MLSTSFFSARGTSRPAISMAGLFFARGVFANAEFSTTLARMTRLTIRIDLKGGGAIGPGKIRLLEEVAETGSIRKAAAAMNMSYRRGWLLLKALDDSFGAPVVTTSTGGAAGGGARLTALGAAIVASYRRLERTLGKAAAKELTGLEKRRKARKPLAKPKAVKRRKKS